MWIGLAGLTAALFWFLNPVREHWDYIFRPAALELIHLKIPYLIKGFVNPP